MRNLKNAVLLAIIIGGLWGCKSKEASNKELIVNTWKVTSLKDSTGSERNQELHIDSIRFEINGKVTVYSSGEPEVTDYALSEDGKTFIVLENKTEKVKNEIVMLNKNKLVFKDMNQGMTVTLERE